MILRSAAFLAVMVSLVLAGSASAADPVNIEIMAVDEEPGRMVLTVSAVDENGKPFPGLDPSSFNAWINDTALIVKELHSSTDRQPASVLLLVDVSTSMVGEPIEQAKSAIKEFINVLEPHDEVAVMAFAGDVRLMQDFTADRAALDAAVANLALLDGTALYDGVMQAVGKMTEAPRSRKLIVLLSDGVANINHEARDASIQAARDGGVSFIAVGLGAEIDREYLAQISGASGGSVIEAATPAELRQAYTNLAFAIRSQYTLVTEVPRSIDRTIPGTLRLHVIYRADNAFAERGLEPLPGAVPPPFRMALDGIEPGDKHNGAVELIPTVEEGIEVVKVDYILDDQVVHTTSGVGGYTLDASVLENGSHVIKVVATDVQGREGEVQVPFLVPVLAPPPKDASLPILPLVLAALLVVGTYFLIKIGRKRWLQLSTPTYSRVDTWASIRTPRASSAVEEDSAEAEERPRAVNVKQRDTLQGRLVIMDENAVRGGELENIREFEMRSLPLTFGSGPDAEIRVGDAGGLIAAEEARVWVQRGRLVYHKLTTLSAMATEGVTAGWHFLNDGDEMRIGPYRLIFQAHREEKAEQETVFLPDSLPQEHGMALHRSFGLTDTDRSPDLEAWAAEQPPPDMIEEAQAPPPPPDLGWNGEGLGDDATVGDRRDEQTPPSEWSVLHSAPQQSEWEFDLDNDEPDAVPGSSSSLPAGGWDTPLLEPRSADWLVEQSQPVTDGPEQIVHPDSWGTFVSGGDDLPSGYGDGSEPDDGEEDRAWGT